MASGRSRDVTRRGAALRIIPAHEEQHHGTAARRSRPAALGVQEPGVEAILHLQRTAGNAAVARALATRRLHRYLEIRVSTGGPSAWVRWDASHSVTPGDAVRSRGGVVSTVVAVDATTGRAVVTTPEGTASLYDIGLGMFVAPRSGKDQELLSKAPAAAPRDPRELHERGRLLIKTIDPWGTSPDSLLKEEGWGSHLENLRDPAALKDARRRKPGSKRVEDLETGRRGPWKAYDKAERADRAEDAFTRKTSVSLLPPGRGTNPYSELAGGAPVTGVMYDLDATRFDPRYVFGGDASTGSERERRSWQDYSDKPPGGIPKPPFAEISEPNPHRTNLATLRAAVVPTMNELLVGLCAAAVRGVFYGDQKDQVEVLRLRLMAMARRDLVDRSLAVRVGVYAVSPQGISEYSAEQQMADVQHLLDDEGTRRRLVARLIPKQAKHADVERAEAELQQRLLNWKASLTALLLSQGHAPTAHQGAHQD
jgi:hypothetical protein